MQSYVLTVDKFLDHAAKWWQDREIVTAEAEQPARRTNYAELRARSNFLSGALATLGLRCGDRVGTLGWNTQHHLEMYYALMGVGLVCHTLNPRLTAAHLAAMINEAQNRALAVAGNLAPLLAELAPLCPNLEHIILMDGDPLQSNALRESDALREGATLRGHQAQVWGHEDLLKTHGVATEWGCFDEETAAGLCYTSGTTGQPKGVLYTHRSNYLHTLRALQADAFALTASDVLLTAVPMFHANAWGFPFAAPAVGAKLVLPGRQLDGRRLASLMFEEAVTVAAGVPTVWLGLVDHLDAVGGELPALERVIIGGSSCPDTLIRRMEERLDVTVQTCWGMTELSPLGTISPARGTRGTARASGHPVVGLDLKLTDEHGIALPQQRNQVGRLKVKGASVIEAYFNSTTTSVDRDGYFDTGDLAVIDETGSLTITGRSKDLIKSGGEWINPGEIEEIIGRLPSVALVAVVARPDAKWGERPVLIVEARQGHDLEAPMLVDCLRGRIPDWWLPDRVVLIARMPLAATGKIDKKQLRIDYGSV